MRVFKTFLLAVLVLSFAGPVMAQEEAASSEADFAERLVLAEQMEDLRPIKTPVDKAIETYVQGVAPDQQETYRNALRNVLNYAALKKISVDSYAETFTKAELQAMVDYYSKPEAVSAADKSDDYAAMVYPEIVRMLDKAMMRIRTGGLGP